MTPATDNRQHVRELIQSFAQVDEYFDSPDRPKSGEDLSPAIRGLNNRLSLLLSFPLKEANDAVPREVGILGKHELARLNSLLPIPTFEPGEDPWKLREMFRDNLYEFLLRIDHCSLEQLHSRIITIPPAISVSLMHVKQLVVYLISECLNDLKPRQA